MKSMQFVSKKKWFLKRFSERSKTIKLGYRNLYIFPNKFGIYWIFACILIVSKILFQRNFLKLFLQTAFQLNEAGWDKLNFRWAYFFIFLALLNEIVWRTQPETTWVNFKVWGILPITFVFTAFQVPLINKYKI